MAYLSGLLYMKVFLIGLDFVGFILVLLCSYGFKPNQPAIVGYEATTHGEERIPRWGLQRIPSVG